jgi:hypothetical protein
MPDIDPAIIRELQARLDAALAYAREFGMRVEAVVSNEMWDGTPTDETGICATAPFACKAVTFERLDVSAPARPLQQRAVADDPRRFPVMIPYDLAVRGKTRLSVTVPWAMVAPHEAQAMSTHRQTLEELARRGGLSPTELVAVLTDSRCGFEFMRAHPEPIAQVELMELVARWQAAQPFYGVVT